ncbi:MAG: hypothetical protein ABR596_10395, partial [Halarsenatibacteraceae bacterium]
RNKMIAIFTAVFLAVVMVTGTVMAEEDDDLQWRMELIEASREMMEENNTPEFKNHKLGTVFTTYGDGDNLVNSGIRFAPQLGAPGGRPLRFIGEIFYLRGEDEIAGFMSISYEPISNLYLGAGGDVIGEANYHLFAGWNVTENIFIEARAINTGGSFEDSNVYPVAGFQINF